ncbi:DUF3147 family protein [Dictyobacter arantiisoli]|uniref:DUF3147 domain-containing protein n=1 Tax=Dictyobacter arantiisoli TaxID=2014874 RepID=A0A5A5TGG2_9CHLR|nr:DUF3147 family protein [Dictyobacter arantiisoli]GCF10298.1 hypothetical protein KDI_38620 [Dictyobacter arantiisoli]
MLLEYLARFLAGGLLVCIFALISQICQPKQFGGFFSAAPSVFMAGLVITLCTKGAAHATLTAQGAIAGAVGMIFYCLVATPAIKRYKLFPGLMGSLAGWFVVAFGTFAVLRFMLGW